MPILPFMQQKPQRSAPTVTSIGQVALRTKKVSGGTELKITPKYDNPTLMSKLYSFWVQALYLDISSDRFERKQICMYNIRCQKSVFFFRHFFFWLTRNNQFQFLITTDSLINTIHLLHTSHHNIYTHSMTTLDLRQCASA